MVRPCSGPTGEYAGRASVTRSTAIATMGIDIGKNSFHIVGPDRRSAIVLLQKWSRGQVEARLATAKKRLHHNVVAIALANKLTRIAWSVLNKGRNFPAHANPGPV